MITSGQRAKLRSMAQTLNPIFHVGKNGINDNFIKDVDGALGLHELIKIAVLRNSDLDAKSSMSLLCDALDCEPVTAIGSKFVIYRRSSRADVEHIEI
ncbi:MAG: YhbY family RNA-binding protein [Bacteroides sp.]|nr:YhbY family RNA-binding protein [Bacillota bacterium]MCM1394164.1 YhbY family RNA-binding protein [[Eubacterium] siraeum]MCM1455840.1 YhbY family RNA-binding protein [Bacteroides sp.]